ncbi:MAG: NUDIX hydrolase, partial [Bacteroidota bacterium]
RQLPAAGGVVRNFAGQWLVIFRRDSWDLPKGKIDPGETPEQAAVREVREETGLQNITLGAELPSTYHTYPDKKGRRVLKRTYWYFMDTNETTLVPQTEEDIEQAIWMSAEQFLGEERPVYTSIRRLLETAQKGGIST